MTIDYDSATFYELVERSIKNHFKDCEILKEIIPNESYWHTVSVDTSGRDNVEAEMGALNSLNRQLLVFREPIYAAIRFIDSEDISLRGYKEVGGRNWKTEIRISLGYKS